MFAAIFAAGTGLAAQSIIDGPGTLAPPSFEGMGWLVVINLAAMTASFLFASALTVNMAIELWVHRKYDRPFNPVSLWRWCGLLIGLLGHCASEPRQWCFGAGIPRHRIFLGYSPP